MIKLIAFDLDGTLTQHKTKLDEKNRSVLDRLSEKYSLVMVGEGQCMRIFNQMDQYPIDIIGKYGLQYMRYSKEEKTLIPVRDLTFPCERDSVSKCVTMLREKYDFTDFKGENVEFHPSGCVTIPILGTQGRCGR